MNYIWYLLLAAFWGGSFIAIKIAVNNFPPFFNAFLRVALSLAILGIIFRLMKKNLSAPFALRWKMWLVGLFIQGIPFIFLFWGQHYITPGLGGILNGTVPIWALMLSPLLVTNTDFSANKIIGLMLGMFGLLIIFSPMIRFSGEWIELLGSLALLVMAICYAIGGLLNQRFFAKHKELLQANIYQQHWASLVLLFLVTLIFEKWPTAQMLLGSPTVWLAIGYLALFSTALAWLMFFWLIQEWGAVRASTVTYLTPLTAILWDFLFFHNVPPSNQLFGVVIILVGVVLIQIPREQLCSMKLFKAR